jgi:divinyl protochlorophyllide a 8-vinyl-reductase
MNAGATLGEPASLAVSGTAPGRIGPNAITRIAEAIGASSGPAVVAEVFDAAGLSRYLSDPPSRMVDEREVTRLHSVLRARLGPANARALSIEAGRLTGDYLLANRIPRPMRWLLPKLPSSVASRVLLVAVSRHAWTFAGSGAFRAEPGRPVRLSIRGCPICKGAHSDEPLCEYYAATFERLYRALVHPGAVAMQTSCEAAGADACGFELRW